MDYQKRIKINKKFIESHEHYLMGEVVRRILPEKTMTGKEIKEKWRDVVSEAKERFVFYTHIPYCLKKCSFCMYRSEELKDPDTISNYVEALTKRYDYYADVFKGKTFSSLYFGGGTPNILSDRDIDKLFTSLYKNYAFSETGERTFEGNPVFATPVKLKLLHDFGINRVSFGVQSFDGRTLQKNNRAVQNFSLIERAVKSAQDASIPVINLDLIMGFAEETVDDFIESFRKALTLDVTKISVYPIQYTYNYLEKFFDGSEERFMDYRKDFIARATPKISEILQNSDFYLPNIGGIFSLPGEGTCTSFTNKNKNDLQDNDTYFFNTSISPTITFGNGISAMSGGMIAGFYSFLREFGADPANDVYEAVVENKKERMADYLFNAFASHKVLSLAKFKDNFNEDITEVYKEELSTLMAYGRIEMRDDKLIILAEEPKERIEICLFLLDEGEVSLVIPERINNEKTGNTFGHRVVIKEEYLKHTEEVYKKMSSLVDPVATYIFDGAIKDVSDDGKEAVLVNCRDGKTKKVKLSDQLMVAEQYILAEGDEAERNIWREISLKELLADEDGHLSHVLKTGTDQVLAIRKIILTYC